MAEASHSPNRRRFYRQLMYLRVDLRTAGVRVPIPATLVDISAGGCQLHARTMLKPHTSIEYHLPRPGHPNLRIAGTIKKVTYTPSDRTFKYAVEFAELGNGIRDALQRFITEEQRRLISISRPDAQEETLEPVRRAPTRLYEPRQAPRVEVNVPVRYTIGESPTGYGATALDVSTGGIRLVAEQILRREWVLTIRFTLPSDVLKAVANVRGSSTQRPFSEMQFAARPLPGVTTFRGRFVQSLAFIRPDPGPIAEIERFVEAARLTALRR